MRLSLTEDQSMLESSVRAWLDKEYDFARRRLSLAAPHACRPEHWAAFARMGWLALPIPERCGGLDGGMLETGLLARAFGRHMVVEPYLACAVLGAGLVARIGRPEQCRAWMPELLGGRSRVAFAHDESAARGPWAPRTTRATRVPGGWRLDGTKLLVSGAPGAQRLLVSAAVEGGAAAPESRLFVVSPDAPGVERVTSRTSEGACGSDITLHGVRVEHSDLLGADVDVTTPLAEALARYVVAQSWEASGALAAAYEQTAVHTRQRVQFGQPLARFQAVSHRLADMAVCGEEALAACELAALRIDRGDADPSALASMVRTKVDRCARFVAEQAVQLHGAMGMTDEMPIAGWFRMLLGYRHRSESGSWHAHRYAESMLASGAWRTSTTLPASDAADGGRS